LTTLWLCENKLQAIDGLEGLPVLKVLWLCGNEIDTIGDGLQHNLMLEVVKKKKGFRSILVQFKIKKDSCLALSFHRNTRKLQ
jgi:hypothetical protein